MESNGSHPWAHRNNEMLFSGQLLFDVCRGEGSIWQRISVGYGPA